MMPIALLAAASFAAPAPAPEPAEPAGARARANLAGYISADDYPIEAIRAQEQGTVKFTLDVGPDGRVARCTVTESSRSASLDETTCRILTERARFSPARDPQGRAVADRVSSAVRWVIPEDDEGVDPEIAAVLNAWLLCLRPHVIPHLPNAARSTRDIAEAAFPACLKWEDEVAALVRADRPQDAPAEDAAAAQDRQDLRGRSSSSSRGSGTPRSPERASPTFTGCHGILGNNPAPACPLPFFAMPARDGNVGHECFSWRKAHGLSDSCG